MLHDIVRGVLITVISLGVAAVIVTALVGMRRRPRALDPAWDDERHTYQPEKRNG